MWWLIGSAPDFWGRNSHDNPDALQDHCEIINVVNLSEERETYHWGKKISLKNISKVVLHLNNYNVKKR